jgi:TatA/E family protein of Tat protein translocase
MSGILLFLDISSGEILVIILVVMFLFGPKQIPVIARTIGKGLYELRRASDQIKREVMQEATSIEQSVKDPINRIIEDTSNKVADNELNREQKEAAPIPGLKQNSTPDEKEANS